VTRIVVVSWQLSLGFGFRLGRLLREVALRAWRVVPVLGAYNELLAPSRPSGTCTFMPSPVSVSECSSKRFLSFAMCGEVCLRILVVLCNSI